MNATRVEDIESESLNQIQPIIMSSEIKQNRRDKPSLSLIMLKSKKVVAQKLAFNWINLDMLCYSLQS